jgi:DNA-binding HxlR family transcriptional regulator
MRSYGHHCALAKALDVIGDRWTLLIVRELMMRDGCRYTDLRKGLPGIATNLLAERIGELERAGVVARENAPPPVATTLFRLTPRGRELEPVVAALGRWGAPLLATGSGKGVFLDHWVMLPLRLYVRDQFPDEPPIRVGLRAGNELVTLDTVGDGSVRVQSGNTGSVNARMVGTPQQILALLCHKTSLTAARAKGLQFHGDRKVLRRLAASKHSASAPV